MASKRPLGKALRTTVVLCFVIGMSLFVFDFGASMAFATFGAFTLVCIADFGGNAKRRTYANLGTSIAGVAVITLAAFVSQSIFIAVIVTAVLGFVLGYIGIFRGYVAIAFIPIMLPYVLSLTGGHDIGSLSQNLIAYIFGCAVAIFASVALWNSSQRYDLRVVAGQALKTAASVTAISWPIVSKPNSVEVEKRMAVLDADCEKIHEIYDGKLTRPGPGSSPDRGLIQLIEEVSQIRLALHRHVNDPEEGNSFDMSLMTTITEVLDQCGDALLGNGEPPSVGVIETARNEHFMALPESAAKRIASGDTKTLKPHLDSSFKIRMLGLLAALVVRHTRLVLGANDDQSVSTGSHALDEAEKSREEMKRPVHLLRSQFSLDSPWFRQALRSALALAIAVFVIMEFRLEHGFWVALGAFSAMCMDAGTTRRSALGALVGTLLGFLGCVVIIQIFGTNTTPLLILLPFVAFLSVWLPAGKHELAMKQTGYTVLFVLLGSLSSGETYGVVFARLDNVTIGLVIAIVVSTLLWPHGLADHVFKLLKESAANSAKYFNQAYMYETSKNQQADRAAIDQAATEANRSLARANEAFDLALNQGGKLGVDAAAWSPVSNSVNHIQLAASMVKAMWGFGLAPIPDAELAEAYRRQAHRISNQLIERADTGTFDGQEQDDAGIEELTLEVGKTIDEFSGKSGEFELDEFPGTTMTYGKAATTYIWALDWLIYFDWIASKTAEEHTLATNNISE